MNESAADADRQQIEKIGRFDAEFQRNIVEDDLCSRIVGRDIKHIRFPMSGCEDIDEHGDAAAYGENRKCAKKTTPGEIGFAIQENPDSDQNQQDMPEIPVQSQSPVNSAKTVRDGECCNAAEKIEILHKRRDGGFQLSVL